MPLLLVIIFSLLIPIQANSQVVISQHTTSEAGIKRGHDILKARGCNDSEWPGSGQWQLIDLGDSLQLSGRLFNIRCTHQLPSQSSLVEITWSETTLREDNTPAEIDYYLLTLGTNTYQTSENRHTIADLAPGDYDLTVQAVDLNGLTSLPITQSFEVN